MSVNKICLIGVMLLMVGCDCAKASKALYSVELENGKVIEVDECGIDLIHDAGVFIYYNIGDTRYFTIAKRITCIKEYKKVDK
jgi:hypothetical protein